MNSAACRLPSVSVKRPRMPSLARKRTSAARSVSRIDVFPGAGAVPCAASATAASSATPSTHRALILIILPVTPVSPVDMQILG